MVSNRKGQTLLFGLMIAAYVLIMAILFIDPLVDIFSDVRGTEKLDCTNTSISTGTRLTCIQVDLLLPVFIWVVITAGFGALFFKAKKMYSE